MWIKRHRFKLQDCQMNKVIQIRQIMNSPSFVSSATLSVVLLYPDPYMPSFSMPQAYTTNIEILVYLRCTIHASMLQVLVLKILEDEVYPMAVHEGIPSHSLLLKVNSTRTEESHKSAA
jgi:hypothetical protein